VSHLVSGLGASTNQETKASVLEVVLSDPEFKTEIQAITKEILEEEMTKIRAEVFNMVVSGVIKTGMHHPTASLILNEQVRDTVARAFPHCSFSTWTTNELNATTHTLMKSEDGSNVHYLLEIKEKVVLSDIAAILKLGQMYKAQNMFVPLSSVLVVNSISEQAYAVAERCKIRVIRV